MTEGLSVETRPTTESAEDGSTASAPADGALLRRILLIIGVAALSGAAGFAIVRATLARRPTDPTAERIQALIDEANRLLKALDDQKQG